MRSSSTVSLGLYYCFIGFRMMIEGACNLRWHHSRPRAHHLCFREQLHHGLFSRPASVGSRASTAVGLQHCFSCVGTARSPGPCCNGQLRPLCRWASERTLCDPSPDCKTQKLPVQPLPGLRHRTLSYALGGLYLRDRGTCRALCAVKL